MVAAHPPMVDALNCHLQARRPPVHVLAGRGGRGAAAHPAPHPARHLPGRHRRRRAAARPVGEDTGRPAAPGGGRAGGVARPATASRAGTRSARSSSTAPWCWSSCRPWRRAGARCSSPCRPLIVLAIGLSRIALGVHFLSDVLAGWLLGAAWLGVTAYAFRVWRREAGHAVPPIEEGLEPEAGPELRPAPDETRLLPHPWVKGAEIIVGWVLIFGLLYVLGLRAHQLHRGHLAGPGRRRRSVRWLADVPHGRSRRPELRVEQGRRHARDPRGLAGVLPDRAGRLAAVAAGAVRRAGHGRRAHPVPVRGGGGAAARARRSSSWTGRCRPRRSRPATSPPPCACGSRSRSS